MSVRLKTLDMRKVLNNEWWKKRFWNKLITLWTFKSRMLRTIFMWYFEVGACSKWYCMKSNRAVWIYGMYHWQEAIGWRQNDINGSCTDWPNVFIKLEFLTFQRKSLILALLNIVSMINVRSHLQCLTINMSSCVAFPIGEVRHWLALNIVCLLHSEAGFWMSLQSLTTIFINTYARRLGV